MNNERDNSSKSHALTTEFTHLHTKQSSWKSTDNVRNTLGNMISTADVDDLNSHRHVSIKKLKSLNQGTHE